jgi:hypothetical protein
MKTVVGTVRGLDGNLSFTGSPDTRELGRMHADKGVRYLLGMPREVPPLEGDACPPTFKLEGRRGMWIELVRRESGQTLYLTMKDGEQDLPMDEMQAAYRVRLFIEHWGEETDLTSEIRLSPEARKELLDKERALDEERRLRLEDAPVRSEFEKRTHLVHSVLALLVAAGLAVVLVVLLGLQPAQIAAAAALVVLGLLTALVLFLRRQSVVIDREGGNVLEKSPGTKKKAHPLAEIVQADLGRPKEGRGSDLCHVLLRSEEGAKSLGTASWSREEAAEIAEAINDAIELPESKRKFLRYRRPRPGGTP